MAATLAATALAGQAQEKTLSIIPEPVEITVTGQGEYLIQRSTAIRMSESDLAFSAMYLADYINRYLGIPLQTEIPKNNKSRNKALTASQSIIPGNQEQPCITLINRKNSDVHGGYQLEITSTKGIIIEGNDEAGVFYGVQTLIQLLPTRAGVLPILPAVQINDYPRFAYRGMHLDVVRHFFPVSFIKKYIDYLALHKLNYFHWHLTDDQAWRVEMKCRPELTEKGSVREGEIFGLYPGKYQALPYGGYYTHEEVKEVIRYAADRHITVIPEIDIPGHCMAVLATYPQFSTTPDEPKKAALTWGIFNKFNNVLAPKPEVFDFLKDVFSELCDLFPGQYIHVGGDECAKRWWQESEETQQFMREHSLRDEKALQSYFIHYVQGVVNAKGKTLIGWDEILEGGISEDCVVMNWRRPEFGKKALRTGHRTIFTCSAWSYFNLKESRIQPEIGPRGPLSLEKVYEFQIVPDSLTTQQQELVWGAQGCLWTEYIPTTWKAEFAVFPRMSALAENVWSPLEKKDWTNFARKIEMQFERYELWGARYSEAFFRTQDIERKR
ncbi:beta-N-acetylhexosaminidase [Bacteroides intestinalis]|uniref:beta-N-acetylhexosaminidase n=1 Tax=Bacteroides intestinalis TaxID=329854 RepID=UPI001E2D8A6D|nr:beta-N-acetylhexosaminidase [Bacteroides intestinalis]